VPVGLMAVIAGWYLLPRSRGLVTGRGSDPAGAVLLAATAASALAALSLLSGTGMRPWTVAACAAAAVLAAAGLVGWERRAAAPLLDLPMLAAAGLGPALTGAMCAYLVLFGPLVLIPQVLAAQGESALHAGLLLAALPAGFGLAAAGGERLLPRHWSNRRRCAVGGVLAAACVAALGLPCPDGVLALLLGLTGAGLGCYIPANNAEVMAAAPAEQSATAGGMVNMMRGVGTALGVALTTLALHAGAPSLHAGELLAAGALAVAAVAATWAGTRRRRPVPSARPRDCL
jgi:Major Facilitator Superfamily